MVCDRPDCGSEIKDGRCPACYEQQPPCPYDPEKLKNELTGMFHCPLCGEMVVAGVAHP